jgi:2-methylcitrate dehydratase PrpD
MEKAFVFGVPARNGVTAALLVQSGFTGVDDVFSGRFNFFDRFTPEAQPEQLIRDLGERNEIMNANIKKFCIGGPIQAPLEGLLALISQGIQISDIVKIDAHVPARRAPVVDNSHNPSICLQHVLALMLVDGSIDFESIHDIARLEDPAVLRERAKVNLVYDTEMDKVDPRRPVDVTVTLRDGTTRNHKAIAVPGTMYLPWRWEQVAEKAMDLIGPVLGTAQARKICELVAGIDSAPDIRVLAEAMTVRG